MGAPIDIIQNWTEITADMIIDVRSPAEFAEDHIPDAINMPVLNNEERAEVGTIYKQINAFQARRYAGGLVAGNISQHILNYLQNKPVEFRPLIY
ncbi:MAG: tRNA 2-selenouridine(34) synthase MnmH, partial [Alphaproteobacteria bacterium]|nr:tRNA 2-selenouridine(34) synthase MnmH [Alphaproteobacteria bacterium]